MNEMLTTRKSPSEELTTRSLSARADTVNMEDRSVEAVLSTETPTTVFDFRTYRIIDEVLVARGLQSPPNDQVVMLEAHFRYSIDAVLGSVRDIRVDNGQVVGRLVFADEDERADNAFRKIAQGHLTDVSVGYRALEYEDIPPNTKKSVGGKTYQAGERTLRVTTSWQLRETSVVPIGADEFAKIREEHRPAHPGRNDKEKQMDEQLRAYLETLGLRTDATDAQAWEFYGKLGGDDRKRADELNGVVAADPPADPEGQRSEPTDPGDPEPATEDDVERDANAEAAAERVLAAERQRVADIERMAGADVPADLVRQACRDGWDTERASRAFLDAVRASRAEAVRGNGPGIHDRDRHVTASAIAASFAMRSGLSADSLVCNRGELRDGFRFTSTQDVERAANAGDQYTDASLFDIVRETLRITGRTTHGRQETLRAAVGNADVANVFSTTVGAQLLQAFMEASDSTAGLTRDVDVQNFQSNERTRLGKMANLEKLGRGGTAHDATIADVSESYKIARYAKKFAVDEQDLIDDNMNALLTLPAEMGRAAARLRPDLFYALLLANAALDQDSVALFNAASHSNYNATSGALAAATLQAAITAMTKQTEDSVKLNVRPRYMLIPADLEFTTAVLLRSATRDHDGGNGVFNPLQGIMEYRVDDRLGTNGVTDPASGTAYTGSATAFYLLASPADMPMIEMGYLRGTGRRPQARAYMLDRGQWGVGWDINHNIGVKALGYQGIYKATGTS